MKEPSIIFRPLVPGDRKDIMELCYRTGHYGEDLGGRGIFNDRRLFAMLFALYYVRFEPANCFVAWDPFAQRTAGYILGTHDTAAQEKRFSRRMVWRIVLRALLYSLWRHPESFRMLLHFQRYGASNPVPGDVRTAFPAHLHINVLPDYHARGVGSVLIGMFEDHMKSRGAGGIHLVTSERNIKAVPFYRKHGYSIEAWMPGGLWPDGPGVKGVVFVKRLQS